MTIKQRMLALSLLGPGFVLAVGLVGHVAVDSLATPNAALTRSGSALKAQMGADQMLDALRGDVLSALLAAANQGDGAAIHKELDEHAKEFREQIAALKALPLSDEIRAGIGRAEALVAGAILLTINVVVGRGITQPLSRAVEVTESVAACDLSRRIEAGSADETGQLLGALGRMNSDLGTIEVRQVNELIAEISTASQEQSRGIGQVGEAVTQLDKMTQQNAALVEQAARLAAVVAQFKLP